MIQSKEDYLYYLACDKIALRQERKHPRFMHDIIWSFERLMRKCEYYQNCKHGLIDNIILKWLKFRYVKLSQHLGFSIGFNTCGPGLCLEHYGCIIINQHAKVGSNCRIIGDVIIGATEPNLVPQIGNNVFIGGGAKIIGNIYITDNVCIGANAVVVKSILTPGVTIGGVPAHKISDNNSSKYIIKATEIIQNEGQN